MSYTKGKLEMKNVESKKTLVYIKLKIKDNAIGYVGGVYKQKTKEEALANAKRIVHCVNNYDGLVEMLKKIDKFGSALLQDKIKQAIAKTEEE